MPPFFGQADPERQQHGLSQLQPNCDQKHRDEKNGLLNVVGSKEPSQSAIQQEIPEQRGSRERRQSCAAAEAPRLLSKRCRYSSATFTNTFSDVFSSTSSRIISL